MSPSFWWWIGWFLFLFVLDFLIPFQYLMKVPTLSGSFLFWIIWILAAIASIFVMVLRWRDNEKTAEKDIQ
jgi:uncharacterized membrane protein YhaH (DUF805 family)